MPNSVVDSTPISVPDTEGSQADTSITGSLASFRGIEIIPTDVITDLTSKQAYNYDGLVYSTSDSAQGTVTIAGVLAADTVTVNGLVYTAVAGAKADDTEFTIDGNDENSAADLADSITNDSRTGTLGDVTAVNAVAVVTMTSTLNGAAGNAVTLASSDGGRLAVSGATFAGGTDGPVTVNIGVRGITIPLNVGNSPILVTSFFSSLINDATAQMTVVRKNNKNSGIAYNVFYSAVGTGSVTLDLYVVSLVVPSAAQQTPTQFPALPLNTDPVQTSIQLREDNGVFKIYDCFYLASQ